MEDSGLLFPHTKLFIAEPPVSGGTFGAVVLLRETETGPAAGTEASLGFVLSRTAMNMQTTITGPMLALAILSSAVNAEEADGKPAGELLFERYGCTNCHGADGIHPTSKYVPVLRGKPADYLYENAAAIFGGEHMSGKTQFMHDQFCVGETPEEGCYPTPSAGDLRVIADWLAGNSELPEKKQTPQALYVTSVQAYEQLQTKGDKALLIDVRSRAEVAFLGMATEADANIPYMTVGSFDEWDEKKKTFKMAPNSEFVMRVEELVGEKGLGKDSPIYLMCRSGSRSAKASRLLSLAGYINVYNITDGYEGDKARQGPRKGERVVNGWKNAGLPWTYKLEKDAMYWEL
jgi:rhodanese-related sulfurtransferase/cytochrome c553